MARVTVEDCIEKIPNRFDLVLTASQRARSIMKGDAPTVERDNDKNPVVSLREIAAETVDIDLINEGLVQKLQRLNASEEEDVQEQAPSVVDVDLSELVGDYSDDEAQSTGIQIASASQMEQSGFEDIDLNEIQDAD